MMQTWPLQEAKAKLSQLVKFVKAQGPQIISVHGNPEIVMLTTQEYQRLKEPHLQFLDFMQASPFKGMELNIERDPSKPRDFEP